MSTIYETTAIAAAGRNGRTRLKDGTLSLHLAVPGSRQGGTNPEQLFALGYAACFDSAVKLTAERLKLPMKGSETRAVVGLVPDGESHRLKVHISLRTSGLTDDQELNLLNTAHTICPFAKALQGDADVSVGLID